VRRGFVYFVRDGEAGLIKIGFTGSVKQRMVNLRHQHGRPVDLITFYEGTLRDEREEHAAWAVHRKDGEWFTAAPDLMEYIADVKANRAAPADAVLEADVYTLQAREWALYLEERGAERGNTSVLVVRPIVAERLGVAPGLLENLRNKRSLHITALDYFRIHDATLAEKRQELAEKTAYLERVRAA
jgi:hypothetical protein